MHNFGIAADTMFLDVNGNRTYRGSYPRVHGIFEVNGGPDLQSFWDHTGDIGHLQLISIAEQNSLRAAVDSALRQFQKDNGLTVDGIPGPKTHAKAIEVFL